MSENKNIEPVTPLQRVVAIAALAGIAILAHVGMAPEQIDGQSPTNTTEVATATTSAVPHGIMESTASSSTTADNKYAKFITISVPSVKSAISAPTMSEQPKVNPAQPPIIPSVVLPPLTIETAPTPIEKISLHPETMTVPGDVRYTMNRDAVYLTNLGCSGFLVWNKARVAMGAVTAEHCHLRGSGVDSTPRQQGNDGNTYIEIGSSIEAMTGTDQAHLKKVGTVTEIMVSAADDTTTDTAFAAFQGYTAQEVEAAYNLNKLTEAEMANFTIGDRMYISGWPATQPKNGNNLKRQDFPLAYVGKETVKNANGETLDIIWTAALRNAKGTGCSFGDSGAEIFVMDGLHPRSVGVLSAFYDFTGTLGSGDTEQDISIRQYYENKFGVDMSQVGTLCGSSSKTISMNEGGVVVKPVASNTEIPGYLDAHSPEASIKKAHDEFMNPEYIKMIVDGVIGIPGGKTTAWIDRPVIFYDPVTFSAVLGSYNPNSPDNLELDYFPNWAVMSVYPHEAGGNVPILSSDGLVRIDPNVSFVDKSGLSFGQSVDAGTLPNLNHALQFALNPNDNTLSTYDPNAVISGK